MIITPHAQAFSPGSDLWVCPSYKNTASKWTPTIDWQINFALSKYETHDAVEMNSTLHDILMKTELPAHDFHQKNSIVLIPTDRHFPVRWVLFFDAEAEPTSDFFKQLMNKAKELQIATIRFFLPPQWNIEAMQKLNLSNQIQVVGN